MADTRAPFDDPDAYERYMGRWSRAIGEKFLDWLAAPQDATWLDVGCGNGAFTELVVQSAAPRKVIGIDPSPQQIEHATTRLVSAPVEFRLGTAVDLPFEDSQFDVVVSALAIHFIPDRPAAFREMLRVARPGGIIAGYTWRRSATIVDAPYGPLARALQDIGAEVTMSPTVPEAMPEGMRASLVAAGYADIETETIEAARTFRDFDEYWHSQTGTYRHHVSKSVASLTERDRDRVRETLRAVLGSAADGSVTYASRATAFKARKPQ